MRIVYGFDFQCLFIYANVEKQYRNLSKRACMEKSMGNHCAYINIHRWLHRSLLQIANLSTIETKDLLQTLRCMIGCPMNTNIWNLRIQLE